jgi:hypothetical protein
LSVDVLAVEPEDELRSPRKLEGYSYALHNPLVYSDPDGKNPLLLPILFGAAIGGIEAAIKGENVLYGMGYGAAAGLAGGATAWLVKGAIGVGEAAHWGWRIGSAAVEGLAGSFANTLADKKLRGEPVRWADMRDAMVWGSVGGSVAKGVCLSCNGKLADFTEGLLGFNVDMFKAAVTNKPRDRAPSIEMPPIEMPSMDGMDFGCPSCGPGPGIVFDEAEVPNYAE